MLRSTMGLHRFRRRLWFTTLGIFNTDSSATVLLSSTSPTSSKQNNSDSTSFIPGCQRSHISARSRATQLAFSAWDGSICPFVMHNRCAVHAHASDGMLISATCASSFAFVLPVLKGKWVWHPLHPDRRFSQGWRFYERCIGVSEACVIPSDMTCRRKNLVLCLDVCVIPN